jgi:hypothetical protein
MKRSFLRALTCTAVLCVTSVAVNHAQAPPAPTGLTPQVTGTFVTLSWNAAAGAVSYRIQVGSSPGASNLFDAIIGNTTRVSGSAGNGVYFWRVIAIGLSGASSAPSAESQFTIGGGCVPPGPPQSFTSAVVGIRVTLRWLPPASGDAPTTYVIEAGSAPGLANLFNAPSGSPATELSIDAPPGQYFVRLRAQNACGTSGVSNEQLVAVGSTPACTYAVSPGSVSVPLAGGSVQVNVTATGGCRWQLQSDPFIIPMSNPAGSGSAIVGFSVTGAATARTGQILLQSIDPGTVTAGQVLVQQGSTSSCAVSLDPASRTVPAASGVNEFRVNANPGCTWSVAPLAGFLSIVSAGTGVGSDTVRYLVAANTAAVARAGLIRVTSSVGVQDHVVTQQGVGPLTASFVMKEGGVVTTICQINEGGACTLDGSASTPAAEITAYEWRTVRFRLSEDRVDTYTGVNPTLVLPCTVGGNSQETFDVTLTVRNASGQTNTLTRRLSLVRAGCGT